MVEPMIDVVVSARPNFMKVAPVLRSLRTHRVETRLIHTGQHFDAAMSEVFFRDLELPPPDLNLGCGNGSHAEQTAAILVAVERALIEQRPDLLVVAGDVTGTLAASLAAAKLGIPIAHIEAGLRSRNWAMPEEINRVLTDRLSQLLLTPSRDAEANLRAEGIDPARVTFVGNVMIDSLHRALARPTDILDRLAVASGSYALVTLHRPANVDARETLQATISVIESIAARLPVFFSIHPRTRARLESLDLSARLDRVAGLTSLPPLGYDDFVTLMRHARLVATDSGGIQEETTALGIPCLTLRDETERPITVIEGTNRVVGLSDVTVGQAVDESLAGRSKTGRVPEGWDGHAGERIAQALLSFVRNREIQRQRRFD
ncbi:MAG: UDP-N-acetylglucosamine 2-epimerase (non-hydrolyzing) [Myxococcales bacterium]|jgi:UDP-N-acetylglucosamine 2-epimerase (non-hydrolysing)|nr:UDP-N-acetylglucosamine 2-epimerase (non-hydrolyzing) [Myxococcales bacterium]